MEKSKPSRPTLRDLPALCKEKRLAAASRLIKKLISINQYLPKD